MGTFASTSQTKIVLRTKGQAGPEEYLIIQPKWAIKEIDVTSSQKIVAVAQHFVISVPMCHPALRISVVPLLSPLNRCVHVQPL